MRIKVYYRINFMETGLLLEAKHISSGVNKVLGTGTICWRTGEDNDEEQLRNGNNICGLKCGKRLKKNEKT